MYAKLKRGGEGGGLEKSVTLWLIEASFQALSQQGVGTAPWAEFAAVGSTQPDRTLRLLLPAPRDHHSTFRT
jgi:hypothetical protein